MKRILLLVLLVAACSKPADGVNGSNGIDGINGKDGQNGSNGQDGANGSNGADGSAGHDASPVTVVKLCPNDTAHYPDVFVEVAICLNNKLYGVYSANGGFFSELPPGSYSSNAIGSACSLTVLPNCIVQ